MSHYHESAIEEGQWWERLLLLIRCGDIPTSIRKRLESKVEWIDRYVLTVKRGRDQWRQFLAKPLVAAVWKHEGKPLGRGYRYD